MRHRVGASTGSRYLDSYWCDAGVTSDVESGTSCGYTADEMESRTDDHGHRRPNAVSTRRGGALLGGTTGCARIHPMHRHIYFILHAPRGPVGWLAGPSRNNFDNSKSFCGLVTRG